MDRIIEVKVYGSHVSKDSKYAGTRGEGNVANLRITFDEGWDGYEKTVTFWDACGENPARYILGVGGIENITEDERVYIVPIPLNAMRLAGTITFEIEGTLDNKKQIATDTLEVKDSPTMLKPVDPTPTELQQTRQEIEKLKDGIKEAAIAAESIKSLGVSVETLPAGEDATVKKTEKDGVTNLHFKIPEGEKGDTGSSGVYIGDEEPSDPAVNVWIAPNGEPSYPAVATLCEESGSLIKSIKDFGAVGDGVTDDTEALKAAARCGEAVYFPKGTYLLHDQIDMTASINWFGDGVRSVIKLMPAKRNCSILNHSSDKSYSLSLEGLVLNANRNGYKNDILGNGASEEDNTSCLLLNSPSLVYLNNVKVTGGLDYGCYIYGTEATDVSISNCRFSENGVTDVRGDGLFIANAGSDARITNCEFNSNGYEGLCLSNNNGAVVSNIVCHNNSWCGIRLFSSSRNVLTGIMCSSSSCGVIITSEEGTEYSVSNNISGLVTKNNGFGMVFGYCDKTVIAGWSCAQDEWSYFLDFPNADKEITGSVFGFLDYKNGTHGKSETTDESKFKVNIMGG